MTIPLLKVGSRLLLLAAIGFSSAATQAQIAIPPSYAMPAGSVDTTQPGFRVRPYATEAPNPNTLAWTEEQMLGLHGPNLADLSGADTNGYYIVPTVNWNNTIGGTVDDLPPADDFPGLAGISENKSEEILSYLEFPTNGVYTLVVNSDDGFVATTAALNPKDHFSGPTLAGPIDGGRGAAPTPFQVSIGQPGIYPLRVLYEQGGGGASISWYSVLDGGTKVLVNDTNTPGALKSYAKATISPPYVSRLSHNLSGFAFDITDDVSALDPSSLAVKLNGSPATVTTAKSGNVTTATYNSPTGFSAGVTNKVDISFADNASPAHTNSASFSFSESVFATIPASAVVPASDVDKTSSGFLFRGSQYDSATYGLLSPGLVRAEEQLAGQLTDSAGAAYVNSYTPGSEANGAYLIPVVNLTLDTSTEQGLFTGTNGTDTAFPGLLTGVADNIAGEITGYLDLKAGLYTFGVNATDGFRVTAGANPFDQFGGTALGIYDFRSLLRETVFNVKVDQDGIYPMRIVLWRVTTFGDDNNPAIEFYNVNSDGTKVLINDSSKTNAIKSYAKRTGAVGTYVSFAGPSTFVSPWANDVGYTNVTVIINDGTTDKVDTSSVSLTIDGTKVTPTVTGAGGKTTVNYPATTTQIARMVHTASLIYKDVGGASHTNNWSFNSWRNHVLPAALYYEDFESTAVGPDPLVPTGWVAFNDTATQTVGNDSAALDSDFYKGWVVIDTSFAPTKDFGISQYTVQSLNGNVFTPGPDDGNPLLTNRFLYAESDARTGALYGQLQEVTTKAFDLSGKTGVVLAFNSSYEQNQDNSATVEYTVDNGVTWLPLLYMLQDGYDGDSPDIFRDPFGNVDVLKTLNTPQGNMYQHPVTNNGVVSILGGTYGAFVKAPITSALAPFIEGRINDDADNTGGKGEGQRFEVLRVTGADNQSSVKFKFHADGTSSWFWAIDNVGIYSVPSLVVSQPPTSSEITYIVQDGKLVLTWSGGGTLESSDTVNGTYNPVAGTSSPATITIDGAQKFFRVHF